MAMSAQQTHTEQRVHPRFLYRQPVLFTLEDAQAYGETRDLSAGGLFIALEELDLAMNSTVRISLRFDGAGNRGEYLARVAHVQRDDDGNARGAGLELIATTPDSRLAWVRHLHWIQEHGATTDGF